MVPQASEAFGERNTEQRAARTRQTQGTAAGEKHRRLRVRAAEHQLGSRSPRDSSVPRQDAPHGPRRSPACRRGRAERGGGARRGAGLRSAERRERHRRPRQSPLPARAARLRSGPSRGPGGVARQRGVHTAVRPPAMAAGLGLPRRRRRLAPSHRFEENNILDGCFLPNDVDLRQVIVLPRAEWERMQEGLGSMSREAARVLAERKERQEMHLRSKAAVRDWTNTIMGQAQRKLKAKKLREEKQEEERKLLDLEEAKFQAAKWKEAIDKAKTYLYHQNERVKGLHSALLLAEVLKERDAQIEFKKLKSDVNKKKEEEIERRCKEALLREEEKVHQRYMNRLALSRDQLEQIKERKHQADLAKLEDKREGEEIQRLSQLYQLELLRKMEKEQEKKVERQRLYHEHVANQKIIKAVEKQKQMEEDNRIRAQFKAKQTIAKLMKEKEAELRRITQEHRDKIVRQLAAQMSEVLKMEDKRIAREIAKKEAAQEKEQKEKEAKKKAAIESIAEHRATVMKMKLEKEREEKAESKKELQALLEKNQIYLESEKAKKQRQRDASIEVQKIQIQQMAEKKAKEQQEKQADLDYNAQKELIALHKEHEFQKYAKQVIESVSTTTHHLYPLLKASKEITGLGGGPFSRGSEGTNPGFQAQDVAETQLPCCSSTTAEEVKTKKEH
ncbi:coiled-coil domain-containing protein 173 isoform X2 [Gallus gallus]|nr:coiled-coil domain-containing protein 173 isoform X2 [Gallus gallus]